MENKFEPCVFLFSKDFHSFEVTTLSYKKSAEMEKDLNVYGVFSMSI